MERANLPDFDESLRPQWRPPPEGHRESGAGPRGRDGYRGMGSYQGAGDDLIRIHNHLRSEAAELLSTIDGVIAGEEGLETARSIVSELSLWGSYSALGSFCSGFCTILTMHHSIEDRQVFPGLGRVEPDVKPVLRRLMEEHEVIADIIGIVSSALEATEDDRSRAPFLREAAGHLADRLSSHLRYEESQLVDLLNTHGS